MDQLNLKIIKDMISDADVKSTDMAKRYNTPLSTIQRRRTKLERRILKREILYRHQPPWLAIG